MSNTAYNLNLKTFAVLKKLGKNSTVHPVNQKRPGSWEVRLSLAESKSEVRLSLAESKSESKSDVQVSVNYGF